MNEELQKAVDYIKDNTKVFNESVDKAAEDSEDVKAGRCTKEDEINEPVNVLFNQISNTSISILEDPELSKMFKLIGDVIGDTPTRALITVLAVTMTNSAYQAIAFYDELLKKELRGQFDNIGHHMNLAKADIESHKLLIEIFRKQLGDITKKLQIDEFKSNMNIE